MGEGGAGAQRLGRNTTRSRESVCKKGNTATEHLLLVRQLLVYAETVSLAGALELLLQDGEVQLIWRRRRRRRKGWDSVQRQ